MTKSLDLNSIAKFISFEIVTTFQPTVIKIKISDTVERYEMDNSLSLSKDDHLLLVQRVKKNLRNHIQSRTDKGSVTKFDFAQSDDDYLTGIANLHPIYQVYPDIYRYLSRMDDFIFEKFSVKYVKLHFCDFSLATRRSKDGGIDFVGSGTFKKLVNFAGNPVDLKSKSISFRMLGQSKRYRVENHIGPKEIREFLGSTRILQEAVNPSKENAWLGEPKILSQIKLAEPFILTFVTTSYYTNDAIQLANKLGIYIYDIDDIIFDLIEHNVGITNDSFNSADFELWCRK